MSHGVVSPRWDWRNIKLGLDEEQAALLQNTIFRSEALVEMYRDVYYGAAGKGAVTPHQLPQRLQHVRVCIWRFSYGIAKVLQCTGRSQA